MTILEDRLSTLNTLHLQRGGHSSFDEGTCVMEATAWIAGEPHSAAPTCVSQVITRFMVSWNDSLPTDDDRDRLLRPLIPLLVGTRTTEKDETVRAWMCTDWLVREQAPAWLRLAGLADRAVALEGLVPLTNAAAARKALPKVIEAQKAGDAAGDDAGDAAWAAAGDAARDAARDAAWAAAWDAAWDDARDAAWAAARDAAWAAAWAAARAAARDAAWDAARAAAWDAARDAAWAAARDAAWAAARDAAWAAARDAAGDALAPTVEVLQTSAALLVKRMSEVGR